MKILIVDDERSIRNSLKEILSDEGYDVDVAEDGATALAMVDKERYNVIFCDIKMPGMDGTEVLHKMVFRLHPEASGSEPDPDHHQERLREGYDNLREQDSEKEGLRPTDDRGVRAYPA